MDRILLKKIAFILCLASATGPVGAWSGEFVKYSEVKDELAAKSQETGSITTDELHALKQRGETVYLYDARSKKEFENEHIQGAALPHEATYYDTLQMFQQQIVKQAPDAVASLTSSLKDEPREAVIVTYCNKNCGISKTLKRQLEQVGFTNVRWLEGGIDVWREKGYPIDRG